MKKKEIEEVNEEIKDEELSIKEVVSVEESAEKKPITIFKVIKIILLVITAPVWLPWKILFVRKPGKKFKDVSMAKKIFRVLRAPITKTLKFALFLFILSVEITLLYKVRYSPITYVITRNSVYKYYLREDKSAMLWMSTNDVYASTLENHYEELKTAFSYIDEWSLADANKMYVLLDADVTKYAFLYAGDGNISYVLNKFNSDETFRNDFRYAVKNVNKTITRLIKELPNEANYWEIEAVMAPISALGTVSVDYTVILDILGNFIKVADSTYGLESTEMEDMDPADIDLFFKMILDYSKGKSIREVYDEANEAYPFESTTTVEVITVN